MRPPAALVDVSTVSIGIRPSRLHALDRVGARSRLRELPVLQLAAPPWRRDIDRSPRQTSRVARRTSSMVVRPCCALAAGRPRAWCACRGPRPSAGPRALRRAPAPARDLVVDRQQLHHREASAEAGMRRRHRSPSGDRARARRSHLVPGSRLLQEALRRLIGLAAFRAEPAHQALRQHRVQASR